jgi:hypothetical protein
MMATSHPNHAFISSDDVLGTYVYNLAGKRLGSIDHLMIDKASGKIAFAVLCFGGFLGVVHRHFPLPWEALKYVPSLEGYRADFKDQDLIDAPDFSDDSWSDRHGEHCTYGQYGMFPTGGL